MRKALLNIITYALLLVSIVAFGYNALPPEHQALIPQWNWLSSLIVGVTSGGIGSVLLFIRYWLDSNEKKTQGDVNELRTIIIDLVKRLDGYEKLTQQLKELSKSQDKNVIELVDLIKLDLLSKTTNPFLDKDVTKLIEDRLGVKKDDQER